MVTKIIHNFWLSVIARSFRMSGEAFDCTQRRSLNARYGSGLDAVLSRLSLALSSG
jgi:hypothetical protein